MSGRLALRAHGAEACPQAMAWRTLYEETELQAVIRIFGKADRECSDLLHIVPDHDAHHEGGIDAARQKRAHGNVRRHPLFHRCLESAPYALKYLRRRHRFSAKLQLPVTTLRVPRAGTVEPTIHRGQSPRRDLAHALVERARGGHIPIREV